MTLLEKFRKADERVDELEMTDVNQVGYGEVQTTKRYDKALAEAQRLYAELESKGLDPFYNVKYY